MKTAVRLWVFYSLFFGYFSEEAISAENIICEVDKKFFCNKNGCQETAPNGQFIKIDTEKNLYQLCDPKGCDSYELKSVNFSGVFVSYKIQGNAFLKRALSDGILAPLIKRGDFYEQRDNAFGAFLSWGVCK